MTRMEVKMGKSLNPNHMKNLRSSSLTDETDISFWGRLTKRLSGQIPAALPEDIEAARLLTKLCSKKVKNEQ